MSETQKQETYPHLKLPVMVGDTNFQTACVLAELHMQNELLYGLLNKNTKSNPIPDQDSIGSLISFFFAYLNDPASKDMPECLPLRHSIRANGTHDNVTLLEDLAARDANQGKA
jgi:hypothetical protein